MREYVSQYQPKIGLVSLGCPKATSDSEHIITRLRAEGYLLSSDYQQADAVIVNTCGFLDSARAESLEAIGEALKENGKVIVTGCLGKDKDFIEEHYNNIISISGPQAFEDVMAAIRKTVPPKHEPFEHLVPEAGLRLTPRHYAYLKIAEGCDNKCSFCIIPSMRGGLVSRPINQVLAEAQRLKNAGVKELLVISQDTGDYGRDMKYQSFDYRGKSYRTKFYDLCAALGEMGLWVRLHYVYPYPHIKDILPLMNSGHILPYLDLPLQHFSPKILKAMRRPGKVQKTLDMLKEYREIVPNLTLRSTFIVGFPGETEEDFSLLLETLKEAQIDRAGCFIYEPVKGASANDLAGAISPDIAQDRYDRFMLTQQKISKTRLLNKVGSRISVILDAYADEKWIGRTMGDAPQIDGNVIISSNITHNIGDIIQVEITHSDEYDLFAEPVSV